MERAFLPGLAAGLAFGTAFGALTGPQPWGILLGLLFLLFSVWRRSAVPLWLSALALGTALSFQPSQPEHIQWQLPLLEEVSGRVVDLPQPHPQTVSFTLEPLGIPTRLLCYVRQSEDMAPLSTVEVGDLVRLRGEWAPAQPEGWAKSLARQGIMGLFWADGLEVLAPGPPGLMRWAGRVQKAMLSWLQETLPREGAELLSALLIGQRGLLPEESKDWFRRAGAAHLLALSGLHLGILTAGGWWALGLLRLRPGTRYLFLIPLVGFYVLVAGMRVSLVRAGIMFALLGLFWVLWERGWVLRAWYDPLQGLSAAAIVVLLMWPWSALDVGFELSFMATGAILLILPSWTHSPTRARLPRFWRRPADLLAVTACAQAGALPLVGSAFGYLAPYGLLANLFLIPWTGAILWAGIILLFCAHLPFGPTLGAAVHRFLIAPYLSIVQGLAALPGAALPVGPGFGLFGAFATVALLLLHAASPGGTFATAGPLPSGDRTGA
jgi:competence protein ComEC